MAKDQLPIKDEEPAPAAQTEPAAKDTDKHTTVQQKYGVLAVVGIAIVLAFTAGMILEHSSRGRQAIRPMGVGGFVMGERGQAGPHGFSRRLNSSDENLSHISGVVTTVNGSTFTVAGHGTTNSVQTTSSTQFTGGDKVAVNDSVLVSGSTANGTFTATQVAINP